MDNERDPIADELEIADLRRQLHRADLEIERLKARIVELAEP